MYVLVPVGAIQYIQQEMDQGGCYDSLPDGKNAGEHQTTGDWRPEVQRHGRTTARLGYECVGNPVYFGPWGGCASSRLDQILVEYSKLSIQMPTLVVFLGLAGCF